MIKNAKLKEGYIIRDQEKIHFIMATVVDWIDVFTRKSYKDVDIKKEIVLRVYSLNFDSICKLYSSILENNNIIVNKIYGFKEYKKDFSSIVNNIHEIRNRQVV